MANQAQETRPMQAPTIDKLAGAAVFLLAFAVYLKTMPSGFPFGDSAELAAVSYTLGIAHPTTYPLFTILSFIWSHLPLPGTPMYRLDVFAALLTALSAWSLQDLLSACDEAKAAGTAGCETWQVLVASTGGLAYAFASIIWDRGAGGFKEYALQLALFGGLVFFALRAVLRPGNGAAILPAGRSLPWLVPHEPPHRALHDPRLARSLLRQEGVQEREPEAVWPHAAHCRAAPAHLPLRPSAKLGKLSLLRPGRF